MLEAGMQAKRLQADGKACCWHGNQNVWHVTHSLVQAQRFEQILALSCAGSSEDVLANVR